MIPERKDGYRKPLEGLLPGASICWDTVEIAAVVPKRCPAVQNRLSGFGQIPNAVSFNKLCGNLIIQTGVIDSEPAQTAQVLQQRDAFPAHQTAGIFHTGQARSNHGTERTVVKPDDGNVLRHPESGLFQCFDCLPGQMVILRQQCSGKRFYLLKTEA